MQIGQNYKNQDHTSLDGSQTEKNKVEKKNKTQLNNCEYSTKSYWKQRKINITFMY